MKVTLKLLLQFALWNHASATLVPPSETPCALQPDTYFLETRGAVFLDQSLVEYAEALETSTTVFEYGASDHVAHKLMEKAAEEILSLSLGPVKERNRYKKILSSLKTVMSIHYGLPNASTVDPKKAVEHVELRFAECIKHLNTHALWKGTCMAGLLQKGQLTTWFPHFSPEFVKENLGHLLFAAVVTGNLDLLANLEEPPQWPERQDLARGIMFRGSVKVLDKVQHYVPTITEDFFDMVKGALKFGQANFAHHLLPRVLADAHEDDRQRHVTRTFVEACASGALGMVMDLIHDYSTLLERDDLLKGLDEAATAGHRPIVMFLALEMNSPARDMIFTSPTPLIKAAEKNRVDILKFFLVDWKDRRREFLVARNVPKLFAAAAEGGSLEAMRLLLGKDLEGKHLASSFEISFFTLEKITSRGHLDVLEFLWMLEKTDSRLQGIDWRSGWYSAIRYAHVKNASSILEFFLQVDDKQNFILPGLDSEIFDDDALEKVCREGHYSIAKKLLQTDAANNLVYTTIHPGAKDNEALLTAISYGRREIVRLLLQKGPKGHGYLFEGIDPAARGQAPLMRAATLRKLDIVQLLLEKDSDGAYIHPTVAIPSGLLEELASNDENAGIVAFLLRHEIANREAEIRLALRAAVQSDSRQMILALQGLETH